GHGHLAGGAVHPPDDGHGALGDTQTTGDVGSGDQKLQFLQDLAGHPGFTESTGTVLGTRGVEDLRDDVLDEMAPARPADDKALVTEHAERQSHGVAGGLGALFQLFFRFQSATGPQLSFLDLPPQRTSDLTISALCPHKTPPRGYQKQDPDLYQQDEQLTRRTGSTGSAGPIIEEGHPEHTSR